MSREAAKKIVDLMIKHGAEQNAVLVEIQSICADDEFQKYKRTDLLLERPQAVSRT